jgi:hypothetical protein
MRQRRQIRADPSRMEISKHSVSPQPSASEARSPSRMPSSRWGSNQPAVNGARRPTMTTKSNSLLSREPGSLGRRCPILRKLPRLSRPPLPSTGLQRGSPCQASGLEGRDGIIEKGGWSKPSSSVITAYCDRAGAPLERAPERSLVELAPIGAAVHRLAPGAAATEAVMGQHKPG